MIFAEPELEASDHGVLELLGRQREQLALLTLGQPRRWLGSLRRLSFARAMRGTNSIEGYHATLDEAVAAVDREPAPDPRDETALALRGYRDALTYILQAARDPYFELSKQFLKSLHFMMVGFDLKRNPGQYRPGFVQIVNERTGEVVYVAPDVSEVDRLVGELIAYLRGQGARASPVVRAAIAHLNLTMIHPFSDGNGRMARALQTFVLAREGVIDPVFASIEEWLGSNTDQYYAVLAEVGEGRWNPARSALAWVRFCLRAHYQQAATTMRRNDEYGRLFGEIERLVEQVALPPRATMPLFEVALGLALSNARYAASAEVASYTATRDLRQLVEAGLLDAHGEKRGRSYRGTLKLRNLREKTRLPRAPVDPYDIVGR